MYQETFAEELAMRVGSRVEIATDDNCIEGILSSVTAELVLVIEVMGGYGGGYGQNNRVYIAVDAINFVSFPAAA